jgi:hypothetical protein
MDELCDGTSVGRGGARKNDEVGAAPFIDIPAVRVAR